MDFVRARTKEQISNRQEEIIQACDALFEQGGYEEVNFKAISEMTSFTRPSIYNYYKTKDEILLDLLTRELLEWQDSLLGTLQTIQEMSKEEYCNFLTQTLVANDKMLKLFSHLFTTFEKNSGIDKLVHFKKEMMKVMKTVLTSVEQYFPNATVEHRTIFVSALFSYVLGLYPMSHLTPKQMEAISLSEIEYVAPDFEYMCNQGIRLLLSDL